jgi:hypothetical protein
MAARTIPEEGPPNGATMASFLGAGVGAFALGAIVLLNEAGLFAAPALYAPAGGVTGRTTLAVVLWLIAWGVLHYLWRGREIEARRVCPMTLVLVFLGVLATFPPVWRLL